MSVPPVIVQHRVRIVAALLLLSALMNGVHGPDHRISIIAVVWVSLQVAMGVTLLVLGARQWVANVLLVLVVLGVLSLVANPAAIFVAIGRTMIHLVLLCITGVCWLVVAGGAGERAFGTRAVATGPVRPERIDRTPDYLRPAALLDVAGVLGPAGIGGWIESTGHALQVRIEPAAQAPADLELLAADASGTWRALPAPSASTNGMSFIHLPAGQWYVLARSATAPATATTHLRVESTPHAAAA